MEYLLISIFLGFAIYNLRESRNKKIRISIKTIYNIILLVAGILYSVLVYKMGKGIKSFIAAISGLFYIYTIIYCQGIGEDGFYVLLAKSGIRKVTFADIRNIKVDEENYKLEIYANSDIYKQVYKKEDFEKVLDIIENFRWENRPIRSDFFSR